MQYRKTIYSGVCVCTHPFDRHHVSWALNPEYVEQTGENRVGDECLQYGFNEFTDRHCPRYHDKDDPEPDPFADFRATDPAAERRDWDTPLKAGKA